MEVTFRKDNTKKYLCSVCDEQFSWSSQSSWFGSYKDLENGKVDCVCSEECKNKHKKENKF
jgi:hypothetical protein